MLQRKVSHHFYSGSFFSLIESYIAIRSGHTLLKDAPPEVCNVCMAILPSEDPVGKPSYCSCGSPGKPHDIRISLALEEPNLQKTLHRINPFTHTLDDVYYKPQLDATVRRLSCTSPEDRGVLQGVVSQRVQEVCLRQIVCLSCS